MSIDPVVAAFQGVLESTDDMTLLLTAEAAGRAVDSSVAAGAAATAIGTAVGYPFANYHGHTQTLFRSLVLTRLQGLHQKAKVAGCSWYF